MRSRKMTDLRGVTALRMHKHGLLFACAAFAVTWLAGPPASGQARDVFSVGGVPVDERASDELSAKSAGIARAERAALRILLERLTLIDDHDRLPAPDGAAFTALMRDFSVDREKFGGGRYLASLTVRFKADAVRMLLRDAEIPFAETASRPVLVLPVFQTAGTTTLWDDTNPWFAAWSRLGPVNGLLPLLLPVGDLTDVTTISAGEAVLGDQGKLSDVAGRYGSIETLVTVASLTVDQFDGVLRVEVATSRYGGNSSDQTDFRRFEAKTGSSRDDLLDQAARALARGVEEAWKQGNLLERSIEQRIVVRVPFDGLGDWLSIRKRLGGIAALKDVAVLQLSVDRAEIEIVYLGNADQLRLAMAQSDLDLSYSADEAAWTLNSSARR